MDTVTFLNSRFFSFNLPLKKAVMKKRTTTLLFATVFFLACMAICGIAFRCSRTQIHTAVNGALQEAGRLHYDDRINTLRTDTRLYADPALKACLLAPVSNRKIKSYTLRTLEKKTAYVFRDSLPEATARKLLNEYLLADILPVKVEEVNRLFQAQLSRRHISGTAGVLYSDKSARTRTRAGILPTPSAYRTPVYPLDLTHNLRLQGWTDYDLLTRLRYIPVACYGAFCLLLVAGAVLLCLRYGKQRKRPAKGLCIDLTRQVLLIDGIQCGISRLDLQILHQLWEKKGECVDRKDIQAACWPHDAQADEKLETHIQTIRKILRDFPDYRVVTVRGRRGYCLSCPLTADSAPD